MNTTIKEQFNYIFITIKETIKILITNAKILEVMGEKFRHKSKQL
jgi:hypothetical protein